MCVFNKGLYKESLGFETEIFFGFFVDPRNPQTQTQDHFKIFAKLWVSFGSLKTALNSFPRNETLGKTPRRPKDKSPQN